ncbi:MAG: type II toxin-antitoxin system VapC family toxin [Thaumarchaeota archaeon]|nr:MAG: type II toxin-antitoxin system VapC family toxin [Nitrososphaerota archaeon]
MRLASPRCSVRGAPSSLPPKARHAGEDSEVVRASVEATALDSDAAEEAAKIMGSLLRIGQQVNALDVLIAGTAVANGAEKIISKDRDYEKIAKVSDLKLEILR